MKCPSCGAEIGTSKFCEYCGSQITVGMQKEREQLNKEGCPRCGSTNIQIKRENQGEVCGKKGKTVLHQTVAICNDCGNTWYPNGIQKPRKTWLWVLGWIFIFPLPLTLILLKKKDMKPALKYGIIAAAWIVYLIIAFSGRTSNNQTVDKNAETSVPVSDSQISDSDVDKALDDLLPSETDSEPSETEPVLSETEPVPSETEPTIDQTLIRPEVKSAIDSYEALVKEYCEFMKAADRDDATFYVEYMRFVTKLKEEEIKFAAIADLELTEAENNYYTVVLVRCDAMLVEFAYTLN